MFLIVYVDHSSYYEGKYFRYTFGIKELCGNEFDEKNPLTYSFYVALEMGYFEPKDYTSDKLYKELNKKYTKYLEPIINNGLNYKVNSVSLLEKEIELIKEKVKDYKPKDNINNKVSSLCELIYAKGLKLEGLYYRLNKEYRFQSYLNRINDYFYVLIDLINKEM